MLNYGEGMVFLLQGVDDALLIHGDVFHLVQIRRGLSMPLFQFVNLHCITQQHPTMGEPLVSLIDVNALEWTEGRSCSGGPSRQFDCVTSALPPPT